MEGSILPDMRARHRSARSCKHAPYICKTLTGSRVHDRQFHYSLRRLKVGGGSIRGGRRRGRSDEKNSLCHLVVATLPARGVLKGKIKGSVTRRNGEDRGRNGGADPPPSLWQLIQIAAARRMLKDNTAFIEKRLEKMSPG